MGLVHDLLAATGACFLALFLFGANQATKTASGTVLSALQRLVKRGTAQRYSGIPEAPGTTGVGTIFLLACVHAVMEFLRVLRILRIVFVLRVVEFKVALPEILDIPGVLASFLFVAKVLFVLRADFFAGVSSPSPARGARAVERRSRLTLVGSGVVLPTVVVVIVIVLASLLVPFPWLPGPVFSFFVFFVSFVFLARTLVQDNHMPHWHMVRVFHTRRKCHVC
jgi:hypothetical protein